MYSTQDNKNKMQSTYHFGRGALYRKMHKGQRVESIILLFLYQAQCNTVEAWKENDQSNGSHCPVHIRIVHSSYLTYD